MQSARNLCSFESLEPRVLLAGNVTAVITNGVLKINGDSAANSIEVNDDGMTVEITELLGTVVNNGAGFLAAPGDFNRVVVKLKGGDDDFTWSGDAPVERVDVKMGMGNDYLFWEGTTAVTGKASFSMSDGNNEAYIYDTDFGSNVTLGFGDGDNIGVIEVAAVDGRLFVTGGIGANDITLQGFTAGGKCTLWFQDEITFAFTDMAFSAVTSKVGFGTISCDTVTAADSFVASFFGAEPGVVTFDTFTSPLTRLWGYAGLENTYEQIGVTDLGTLRTTNFTDITV